MICTRCAKEKAYSEAEIARFREHGGPPLPPGICIPCIMQDPKLRADLYSWGDQRMQTLIQTARDLAARPLEAIDRFVESFR